MMSIVWVYSPEPARIKGPMFEVATASFLLSTRRIPKASSPRLYRSERAWTARQDSGCRRGSGLAAKPDDLAQGNAGTDLDVLPRGGVDAPESRGAEREEGRAIAGPAERRLVLGDLGEP